MLPLLIAQMMSGATIPTDTMVYYPFSGNTNDASGNGRNLTNNGASLISDRYSPSNANSAYSFNGTTNFMNLASPLTISGNMTISLWANFNNIVSTAYFLGGADGTNGIRYNGTNFLLLYNSNTSGTAFNWTKTNAWVHFCLVLSGTNTIEVLINGVSLGTTSMSIIGNWSFQYVGKRSDGLFFNGNIDDIRIYNRALNSAEITALANEK